MGHSIAPIPPARYPSIPNKHVIFFHTLMSEIVPDTIISSSVGVTVHAAPTAVLRYGDDGTSKPSPKMPLLSYVTQCENSEVLPSESVAVAVILLLPRSCTCDGLI